MTHEFSGTVFFHDVDKGGVVYFANYLKYLDNARTTLFNELGYGFSAQEKEGKVFAVASLKINYAKSLILDENFLVKTYIKRIGHVTVDIQQEITRKNELITLAEMRLACLDFKQHQRPAKIPGFFKKLLEARLSAS